jgi:hypothetical protein
VTFCQLFVVITEPVLRLEALYFEDRSCANLHAQSHQEFLDVEPLCLQALQQSTMVEHDYNIVQKRPAMAIE